MGIFASSKSSTYDNPYVEPTPAAVKKHRAQVADGPSMSKAADEVDGDADRTGLQNPPRLLAAINHHGLSVFLLVRLGLR